MPPSLSTVENRALGPAISCTSSDPGSLRDSGLDLNAPAIRNKNHHQESLPFIESICTWLPLPVLNYAGLCTLSTRLSRSSLTAEAETTEHAYHTGQNAGSPDTSISPRTSYKRTLHIRVDVQTPSMG